MLTSDKSKTNYSLFFFTIFYLIIVLLAEYILKLDETIVKFIMFATMTHIVILFGRQKININIVEMVLIVVINIGVFLLVKYIL